MRKKVTVIGAPHTARVLSDRDYADVVEGGEQLAGSDVVVIADLESCGDIAVHAPAAVIVVAAGADVCAAVLSQTLFPRGRVIGAPNNGVEALVDAVVLDRGVPLDVFARTSEDGDFVATRARVGARGIEEFLGAT